MKNIMNKCKEKLTDNITYVMYGVCVCETIALFVVANKLSVALDGKPLVKNIIG